ncbi:MAG: hypothetical protein AB1664_02075, partial [Thermodesulfobacteriota bacterium]
MGMLPSQVASFLSIPPVLLGAFSGLPFGWEGTVLPARLHDVPVMTSCARDRECDSSVLTRSYYVSEPVGLWERVAVLHRLWLHLVEESE